jgi:outer membrane protein, adhesin transport system
VLIISFLFQYISKYFLIRTNVIMNFCKLKNTIKLTGLSIASLFAFSVQADELADIVADTISAHPQVKEKVHVYRQVLSDQSIASSSNRPSVDLQASTGLYNTESPSTDGKAVDYDSSRVELSVTQNLFNGYQSTNQIKQNESRAQAALYDLYDSADNIALKTIQAYLNVLKHKKLYQLAQENVASHEGILAQITERNSSGVGRRSQLQQTEGRVARAHASLIAEQNNLNDALSELHQLLGRYVAVEDLVEPSLPEMPREDLNTLIDQALLHHPAVKVASSNIEASQFEYQRSLSSRYPNLDLRLASEWGNDIGGVAGDTSELSLVLNLTYNFYNGGADKSDQSKKISAIYAQKDFAARVRRQIINTLRLAWTADESLQRQLDFFQQYILKASETVDSYREEFFIGQRDLIDLLDAENELNTANNEYTRAYFDLMAARYRVYEALGGLFDALNLQSELSENDLTIARIKANEKDALPLPKDEDKDKEEDLMDHCDNTLSQQTVNNYGCSLGGKVALATLPVNVAPIAANDSLEVDGHGVLIISQSQLLANDSDINGDQLTITDFTKVANGKLAFSKEKNLVYRPKERFEGIDSFTYTVSDGKGGTDSASVSIKVVQSSLIDLTKMQLVNFKYMSAELTDSSKEKVEMIINQIKGAGDIQIRVLTHTDSIGSNAYNMKLSQKRAKAMRELLIARGLDPAYIEVHGMGEEMPMADNASKEGQAINRRGEFIFRARGTTF